ncbi:Aspartyl/glutamyl-tRNA(Asn/Gln) amidotransferase subunit B, partial [Operophtera brumata]
MFLEQCRLLTTMKEEIRKSRDIVEKAEIEQNEIIRELVKKAIGRRCYKYCGPYHHSEEPEDDAGMNSSAKSLMDAIESSQGSVDSEIQEVLVGFLQSEELKERMVQATAESVKDVIGSCLSRDISALYLPILEHSHR